MENAQSFTMQGKMVYQYETMFGESPVVHRYVQQESGIWWQYTFYKGQSVGVPARGKARQAYFLEKIEAIKSELTK